MDNDLTTSQIFQSVSVCLIYEGCIFNKERNTFGFQQVKVYIL